MTSIFLSLTILFAFGSAQVCHTPDYDSGWVNFQSQAGSASYMELFHGLPDYPGHVEVYVKTVGGLNPGYIFHGVGASQASDDSGNPYGGVVFGYDYSRIRLWAPQKNNNFASGHIVFFGDHGWGNALAPQVSDSALVRALAWRDNYASATFNSGWFTFTSQSGNNSTTFVPFSTPFPSYPGRVKVQVKNNKHPNENFIFGALGSAMATDNYKSNYGGLIFAYNQTGVRLWAPTQRGSHRENNIGHIVNIVDGWGGEINSIRADSASVRILAWDESSVTPLFDTTWHSISSNTNLSLQTYTFSTVGVPARIKVQTQAITGNDNGYIFEGVGATQTTDYNGPYGGLVFGYDQNEVSLFAPGVAHPTVNSTGRIIFVADGWGNEVQIANETTANVRVQTFSCFPPPDTQDCSPGICQNNGICIEELNYYICNCTSGYDGLNCERHIIPFADPVIADSPIDYWQFSSIPDQAYFGVANKFILPSSAQLVSFPQRGNSTNYAYQSTGVAGYSANGVNISTQFFSVEIVFAPVASDYTSGFTLFTLANSSTNATLVTVSITSDQRVTITDSTGSILLNSDPYWVATGSTYDLVVVRSPNRWLVYLDGTYIFGTHPAWNFTPGSYRIFSGANFNGILDELAIYNNALSAARIQTHYLSLATFTTSLNQ